jgi:hypothetical protein
MLFSAELPWCLVFVQKSNFQEKSRKILQNSYFTRRPTEPEDETERGWEPGSPPGARPRPGRAGWWWGHPSHLLEPPFHPHIPFNLKLSGVWRFSQIEFHCAATIKNRDWEPETPFWHPTEMGIWRRSSSPSSPTSLHQPSMTSPSMSE